MRVKERSLVVLWNVLRLLEDPRRWSRDGHLAEDSWGHPVDPHDVGARRWSLVGALTKYETTILAINALGGDLKTLELRATHAELLVILRRGITWVEQWREYDSR